MLVETGDGRGTVTPKATLTAFGENAGAELAGVGGWRAD
jgi:hypothetical protein